MDMFKILRLIMKLTRKYGLFDTHDFEFIEIDQRPGFYLAVITLREKE